VGQAYLRHRRHLAKIDRAPVAVVKIVDPLMPVVIAASQRRSTSRHQMRESFSSLAKCIDILMEQDAYDYQNRDDARTPIVSKALGWRMAKIVNCK
jgi:hypothetical protein